MEKTAQVIDGKALSEKILLELKKKVADLKRPPGLAAILIGDDPASDLYVRNKEKACNKIGIIFHKYLCANKCFENTTETQILEMIGWLNKDPEVDGIIVQLPLPKQFDSKKIIKHIDPKKDVDGFHPQNKPVGKTEPLITSPLIDAVMAALLYTGESIAGRTAVVVTKNPIFSDPLITALKNKGLITKTANPKNKKLAGLTKQADVLISVAGQKKLIKKSMVKPGAVVIDVGINLVGVNKFVGDVDPKVKEVAGWLTPVPGGIGPLTVAMLLKNTYQLAIKNQ